MRRIKMFVFCWVEILTLIAGISASQSQVYMSHNRQDTELCPVKILPGSRWTEGFSFTLFSSLIQIRWRGGGGRKDIREGGRGTLGGNDSRFCSEFFTQVLTKVTVAGDIEASQFTLTLRLGRKIVLEQ